MQNIPYKQIIEQWDATVDLVCDQHEPVLVTQPNAKAVVIVSLEDWCFEHPEDEMDETEYLMSNPANAAHLEKSIKDIEEGNLVSVQWKDF